MNLVCLEECASGKIHVHGKENGPRIHDGEGTNSNIMPSCNVKENFYMKQVVIYLLRIWIIDSIPQISALLCKGGLYRCHGYQGKCSLNISKLKCSMN